MNKTRPTEAMPPLGSDTKILFDHSFSVTECFSRIMQAVPAVSRQSVLLGLFQTLLQIRSPELDIRLKHWGRLRGITGELNLGRVFYVVTDVPVVRDFQACSEILRRNCTPVLIVPRYVLHRAHRLQQRKAIYAKVPIFTLETWFVAGIVFEAVRQGRSVADMWQTVISKFNRSTYGASRPKFTLAWAASSLSVSCKVRS
jgi:hypothetical protein